MKNEVQRYLDEATQFVGQKSPEVKTLHTGFIDPGRGDKPSSRPVIGESELGFHGGIETMHSLKWAPPKWGAPVKTKEQAGIAAEMAHRAWRGNTRSRS